MREMKIPILAYQPMYIHGNDYGTNHLRALAGDLRQLTAAGFRIVPLRTVVDLWLDSRAAELDGKVVALTCDDGADFTCVDLPHPAAGTQRSVLNILRDFIAENPTGQPDVHVTSFEIASPEARAALDAACMVGKGWWNDDWWAGAAASGLVHIANHSWDHNHEALPAALAAAPRRGTFSVVTSWELADHEIGRAVEYLRARAPNPGTGLFAYPYGESNRFLTHEYFPCKAAALGIRAAFTAQDGFLEPGTSRWEVPRFLCGRDWTSPAELAAILDAAGDAGRSWVPVYRPAPVAPPAAPAVTQAGSSLREFAAFVASRVSPIPGWLHEEAALLTAHLVAGQRALGLAGPTLEIGVYHAKYLAVLYKLSRPGEPVVGVDLFVGVHDKGAAGETVRANIAAACGENARLKVVIADSLQLTAERLSREIGAAGARFISIDGGHTKELVLHDLEVAAPLLRPGGIMALDDAFNQTTPGVIEAIAEFFLGQAPRLAPFAICFNKLFVTTPEYHAPYLQETIAFLDEATWLPTHERTRTHRAENRAFGFVPAMFGHEVVAFL